MADPESTPLVHELRYERAKGFAAFWMRFSALTKKNLLMLFRRPVSFFITVFSPMIFVFGLRGLTTALDEKTNFGPLNLQMQPCDSPWLDAHSGPKCYALAYSPDNERTRGIMKHLVEKNPLLTKDDLRAFDNENDMLRWLYDHPGEAEIAARLGTSSGPGEPTNGRHRIRLYVNETLGGHTIREQRTYTDIDLSKEAHRNFYGVHLGTDRIFLAAQRSLSEATIAWSAESVDREFYFDTILEPIEQYSPPDRSSTNEPQIVPGWLSNLQERKFMNSFASPIIVISYLLSAFLLMNMIVSEKRIGLVNMLQQVGTSDWIYWLSYAVLAMIVSAVSALLAVSAGFLAKVEAITTINFGIAFFAFFLLGWAIFQFCFMFAAVVTKPARTNWAIFMISLFVVLVSFILSTIYSSNFDSFYARDSSVASQIFLFINPAIQFNALFGLSIRAIERSAISGGKPSLTWSDLNNGFFLRSQDDHKYLNLYLSPVIYLWINFILALCYMVFGVYLSMAWGVGASRGALFFLKPDFWGLGEIKVPDPRDTIGKVHLKSKQQNTIELHKMTKTYDGTTAVKELSLEMKPGQVTALLGQNGAGKSTTINVLTGRTEPTYGEAFVMGFDVREELSQIQEILGVCPQEDILWDELTAKEHMDLYCALRLVPKADREQTILQRLEQFSFSYVLQRGPTRTFSGGMKRTLQIALATIGDVRVLVLDEPTTGMDPLKTRRTWDAVRGLIRDDRIILLTSHLMAEADFLGDTIAIMASGRLRAFGSSLFLKERFGKGYSLNLLTPSETQEQLESTVTDKIPGAEIVSSDSGNLSVAVPKRSTRYLPDFFRWIENGGSIVTDWTLAAGQLEEVFLRLAKQQAGVNEADGLDEDDPDLCQICMERPVDQVVLYTSDGVAVRADNLVCGPCSLGQGKKTEHEKEGETKESALLPVADREGEEEEEEKEPLDTLTKKEESKVTLTFGQDHYLSDKVDGSIRTTSVSDQLAAIMAKNLALLKKARKQNFCIACCTVLIIVCVAVLASVSDFLLRPPPLCPQGFYNASSMYDFDDFPVPDARLLQDGPEEKYDICKADNHLMVINSMPLKWQSYSDDWFGEPDLNENTYNIEILTPSDKPVLNKLDLVNRGVGDNRGRGLRFFDNGIPVISLQDSFDNRSIAYLNDPRTVDTEDLTCMDNYDRDRNIYGKYKRFYTTSWSKATEALQNYYPAQVLMVDRAEFGDNSSDSKWGMQVRLPLLRHDFPFAYSEENYMNSVGIGNGQRVRYLEYGTFVHSYDGTGYGCGVAAVYNTHTKLVAGAIGSMAQGMARSASQNATDVHRINHLEFEYKAMTPLFFPGFAGTSNPILAISQGLILLPFAVMIHLVFFPQIVQRLVLEREFKLVHYMKVAGLSEPFYWLGNALFDVLLVFIFGMLFVIVGAMFKVEVLKHSAELTALFFVWSIANFGWSVFLSSLFKSNGPALSGSYLLLLIITIATFPLAMQNWWPSWLQMIPPFGLIRAESLLWADSVGAFGRSLGLLFAGGFLFLVVGLLLITIRTANYSALWKSLRTMCSKSQGDHHANDIALLHGHSKSQPNIDEPDRDEDEDEDVIAERQKVYNAPVTNTEITDRVDMNNLGIRIADLSRSFPSGGPVPFWAVRHLDLGLDYGETFGLLGPNGAGKTINVLTGLLNPTLGNVQVAGFDVMTQRKRVHNVLGVCPQHNALFDALTTLEHLNFFAALKGVPRSERRGVVQHAAETVELDGDSLHQPASQLSGGQRRRLSIAVSLIGDPLVWLLDEPTTGLDPATRRNVWRVIDKEKKAGRCVVITTHSLEEADALCQRIGIVANGSLRVIGTSPRLKARFGTGFTLSMTFDQRRSNSDQIVELVKTLHPEIVTSYLLAHKAAFLLPQDTAVSNVFEQMESKKVEMGIKEWSVNQSSLADVFARVVADAEPEDVDENVVQPEETPTS